MIFVYFFRWLCLGLFIFIGFNNSISYAQNVTPLLEEYIRTQDNTQKATISRKIAQIYQQSKKQILATKYYLQAIDILEKQNIQSKELADLYNDIGDLYMDWGAYTNAIAYLKKSAILRMRTHDVMGRLEGWQKIALAHYNLQNYEEAFYDYTQVAEQQRIIKDQKKNLPNTYNKLAILAEYNQQTQKAITLCDEGLKIAKEQNNLQEQIHFFNNLGYLYRKQNNTFLSLSYFEQAISANKELLKQKNTPAQEATIAQNIGTILTNIRRYNEAHNYYTTSRKLRETNNNQPMVVESMNCIALNYFLEGELDKCKNVLDKAILLGKEVKANKQLMDSYEILSQLHLKENNLKEYRPANDNYNRYKNILQDEIGAKKNALNNKKSEIDKIENNAKLEFRETENQDLLAINLKKEKEIAEVNLQKAEKERELALSETKLRIAQAEKAQKDKLIAEATARSARQEKELAQAARETAEANLAKSEAEEAQAKAQAKEAKQAQILAQTQTLQATKDKERLEIEQKRQIQVYFLTALAIFFALIMGFILFFFYRNRRKNELLKKQNHELNELNEELNQSKEEIAAQRDTVERERQKSDNLLLNILPISTARELKEKGTATPQSYQMVSVLFTDFKGFTNIASKMTPQEVIKELDKCFLAFDEIIEKYNLEKIKTIGDAYMCAGGLPIPNTTNPIDAVRAGLEIQEFMQKFIAEKQAQGKESWEIRLGIHTGEVIAGVVGKKKFAYDIWGDAVNIASRMESSGEVGKVNISEHTYELVKDVFECEYRGKIYAKNKGDVDMYFVTGEKNK